MNRPGLSARLGLGLGAVAGLTGLLVGLPLHGTARALLEQSLQERAEAAAETIAVALGQTASAGQDQAALQAWLVDLAEEADLDLLTLDDAEGRVLASTDPHAQLGVIDPLLIEAAVPLSRLASQDAATSPVQVDTAGRATVLAVAPVEGASPPLFIAVRAPASWTAALDVLSARIAGAVGLWMVVSASLGAIVARRSLRPLDRLGRAARALAAGEIEEPLPRSGLREIDVLAEDFDRMRGAIVGRERWLRALAGTVAHEVRNPANALGLQLGLLRRALGDGGEHAARFDRLERELGELEATVSSLLAFAEGAPARRQPTSLRPFLQRVAPDASVEASEEVVDIDPVLVGRAVANLVRNARQAGAMSVRVLGRIEDASIVIQAEDDGHGFPPGMAAHGLEPFARGSEGGSGLGLALVAAVARAHGGEARILAPGPGPTLVELRLSQS